MGCFICASSNTELHHIVKRSQSKSLINCKLNLVELCPAHHRGERGVHGKYGHELDLRLKRKFQNKLNELFYEDYITSTQIFERLGIDINSVNRLTKSLKLYEQGYLKEDVIRACLGGRLYE